MFRFLAKEIEDSIASCYQHSNALAPDETMLPLKIRKMCHHMFIRGKPHPMAYYLHQWQIIIE